MSESQLTTANKKDKYRMRIQESFYDFYQRLVVRFRMRYIHLDRIDGDDLLKEYMLKKQSELFLGKCEQLDNERSI